MLKTIPDGQIIFTDPITIKPAFHGIVFTCYGAWTGEKGIFLLDGAGQWHGPLDERQANAGCMIDAVYYRLKSLIPIQQAVR